jgi:hypothetical protein
METLPLRWISTSRPAAGHGVGREALALQIKHDGAVGRGVDAAQREVLGGAAARVGVDLRVDQLRPWRPSPVTQAASPRAAATTLPPTTSRRCSWPRM